jgi:hypothetical protein
MLARKNTMTGRATRLVGLLAMAAMAALLAAGPADAAMRGRSKLDTKPGCFGAGEQGHTRENLQSAKGLKILSVHHDVTGITILDNKNNVVFKGKPRAGQVIPLQGMRFAYLQASTKGANGCLVKYQPQ